MLKSWDGALVGGISVLPQETQGAPLSLPPRGDRRRQLRTRKWPHRTPDRPRPGLPASRLRQDCPLLISPRLWPRDSSPRGPSHVLRLRVGMNTGGQTRPSPGVWGLCAHPTTSACTVPRPHPGPAESGGDLLSCVWSEGTPLSSPRGQGHPSRLAPMSLWPALPSPEGQSLTLSSPDTLGSSEPSEGPRHAAMLDADCPPPGPGPAALLSRG